MGICFGSKNNEDKDKYPPLLATNGIERIDKDNLTNITKLQQIHDQKICALCEKQSNDLKIINDETNPSISKIMFCSKCRGKLGYDF